MSILAARSRGSLWKRAWPLLALAATLPLPAQTTFLHFSDPQFGYFSNNKNFEQETANLEFAIAGANRLKPAFVVVTGDLVHKPGDAVQIAEYKRITARLSPAIKLYSLPGNHDFSDPITQESLDAYRRAIGPDYFAFRAEGILGIALNSSLIKNGAQLPEESARMEAWARKELADGKAAGAGRILVFMHHPLFVKTADEPEQYFNLPLEGRKRYLDLFREYGVQYIFAGHTHKDQIVQEGELRLIVGGPVGKPSGGQSGFGVVKVTADALSYKYYGFGELP